jgi:uncharacterized LabA/DUF88 family protein
VTRDADFKPLLNKANEHGKETIIFGVEPGFSTALKNSADYVILMKKDKMSSYDESDGMASGEGKIGASEYQDSMYEESVEKT